MAAVNIGQALRAALNGWWGDKEIVKWLVGYGILLMVYFVANYVGEILIFGAPLTDASVQDVGTPALISWLTMQLVFSFLLAVGGILFLALIYRAVLVHSDVPVKPLPSGRLLRFVLLYLGLMVYSLLSWHHKKFLWILVVALLLPLAALLFGGVAGVSLQDPASLIGAGIMFLLVLLVSLVLLVVYFFVFMYNLFRYYFGFQIYLAEGRGVRASLEESWRITKGNVLRIFACYLVPVMLMMAVLMPISFLIVLAVFSPLVLLVYYVLVGIVTVLYMGIFASIFTDIYKQLAHTEEPTAMAELAA